MELFSVNVIVNITVFVDQKRADVNFITGFVPLLKVFGS